MPVWHAELSQARREGQVVLLGVIQEQHAERCRLFAQWKGLEWPILHDPLNLLGLRGVPVVVAIDEYGIVRDPRARLSNIRSSFLGKHFESPQQVLFLSHKF